MNIAFVDDEEQERNRSLSLFLQEFQRLDISVHRFDFFTSAEEFQKSWKVDAYDLIILDIIMEKMSGIDLAHWVRKQNQEVRIAFCSTSNEFASESYDIGACYYLQKPVDPEAVARMIHRIDIENFELRRFILLPDGQKLLLRNMLYSVYSNHAITITMKQGEPMKTWLSQKEFLHLLEPYDCYLSTSNGIVLNLHEVVRQDGDTFQMSDDSLQPISRRRKKEVLAQYQTFLLNTLRKGME